MQKRILFYCFMSLFIAGCATHQKNIKFSTTNSMCLDATIANLQAAGCSTVLVTEPVSGITKISCVNWNKNSKNSEWINHEFYAIKSGIDIPSDVKPICTDKHLTMTTSEKD